jgi:tRNA threonylcarbamoyladenosine biosynthesis protein TsaE
LAGRLARHLRPGDVVNVRGELGSGKTAFVRGACRALGVYDPVTSPTYTIGNRYRGAAGPVSHLDLYRSSGVTLDEWADLEPYFDDATVFVEWPEAGAGVLPPPRITVTMRICEGDARLIVLETNDRELTAALADPEP